MKFNCRKPFSSIQPIQQRIDDFAFVSGEFESKVAAAELGVAPPQPETDAVDKFVSWQAWLDIQHLAPGNVVKLKLDTAIYGLWARVLPHVFPLRSAL